jgi:hypothetical protein
MATSVASTQSTDVITVAAVRVLVVQQAIPVSEELFPIANPASL